jgi:hypothetical protein
VVGIVGAGVRKPAQEPTSHSVGVNPPALGSATQLQTYVRHITLFAPKIMVFGVCRLLTIKAAEICS